MSRRHRPMIPGTDITQSQIDMSNLSSFCLVVPQSFQSRGLDSSYKNISKLRSSQTADGSDASSKQPQRQPSPEPKSDSQPTPQPEQRERGCWRSWPRSGSSGDGIPWLSWSQRSPSPPRRRYAQYARGAGIGGGGAGAGQLPQLPGMANAPGGGMGQMPQLPGMANIAGGGMPGFGAQIPMLSGVMLNMAGGFGGGMTGGFGAQLPFAPPGFGMGMRRRGPMNDPRAQGFSNQEGSAETVHFGREVAMASVSHGNVKAMVVAGGQEGHQENDVEIVEIGEELAPTKVFRTAQKRNDGLSVRTGSVCLRGMCEYGCRRRTNEMQ
ncbi:hypothetical protein DL98DRAFT_537362 [Cadophora sp. DSE1049]|nr:hypothetical protein DL98DRAFT_537362 [Cadophora sp. DSE1049]